MLLPRILTALVLIPLFIGAVFYLPNRLFALLVISLSMIGVWEWITMFKLQLLPLAAVIFIGGMVGYLWPLFAIVLTFIGTLWWLYILIVLKRTTLLENQSKIVLSIVACLVFIPALCAIILLHGSQPYSAWLVMYLFVLIWLADSAAYFSGRAFGKRKLAPNISPGKTVEGLLGASLAVFVLALIVGMGWELTILGQIALWILSLLIAIVSVVGDLFISRAKRTVGVKNSGHILPGHGGVLDRIDSLLAAAPVFTLGMYLMGQIQAP